jgi:hypothetical protein
LDEDFAKLPGPDPVALALKQELSRIILWNEHSSPRSQQVAVGPSEIGQPCDRRLAYRIAGIPPLNTGSDPWPAVVGTSVHAWLEKAINQYQEANGDQGWLTELRVYPDPMISGSSDVYNSRLRMVVDHKTTGSDKIRKLSRGEPPPPEYVTQIQVYGLGHRKAGREVERVALVFYPRSGWLDDCYVWTAPYDESVAVAALERTYRIGGQLIDLDIENNPHRFQLIDATPGDACVFCDHYVQDRDIDVAADDKGCPGR